jgi:hypothetical protein
MPIFGIFFIAITFVPEKAFPLTYSKKISTDVIFQDGRKDGRTESEGFYGDNFDFFPICKKMNINAKGLRQGLSVFFKSDGSISSENGIYDCQYGFGKVVFGLVEGINEGASGTFIFFDRDATTKYFYRKINNIWYTETMLADFLLPEDPKSNHTQRPATTQEINHAERLYKFYKEIDLSSPKAKKYKVINTSIHLNETKKTEEQVTIKQQSNTNVVSELEKLDKLFKSGAITRQEYQKAKDKILK